MPSSQPDLPSSETALGPKGGRGRVPGPQGVSEPLGDYAGGCRRYRPVGSSGGREEKVLEDTASRLPDRGEAISPN